MRLLLAAILSLTAITASAQTAATPVLPPPPPPGYIPGAHLDATLFLSPAPLAEGTVQAADMSEVKAAQAFKGSARWIQAQSDDDLSPFTAFAPVLGPAFSRAAAPRTGALFDRLFTDVTSLTAPAKIKFNRPPPLVDPTIETCKPLEITKSYPSGHATRGWLMALVLSEMVPEKANALLARGRDYGDSRVICAEHFPSDVQAGRLIGAAVFAAAKADPAFERDFRAARTELRAALKL